MENIWETCKGDNHFCSLHETAWRVIEAQHVHGTRNLVDSASEQIILEEMIETAKPIYFGKEFSGLHYLLYTPFRYPPLQYGSRFGNHTERALWYGSLKLKTAMAEKAFYQFNFLKASAANFDTVSLPLSAFATSIKTLKGINLTSPPFNAFRTYISSPNNYLISQSLGSAMRHAKVDAFLFHAARDLYGMNIGVFSPRAFLYKKPNAHSFQTWQCTVNQNVIEFVRSSSLRKEIEIFPLSYFLVDGKLPFPAN